MNPCTSAAPAVNFAAEWLDELDCIFSPKVADSLVRLALASAGGDEKRAVKLLLRGRVPALDESPAQARIEVVCGMPIVVGFIDGTVRPICDTSAAVITPAASGSSRGSVYCRQGHICLLCTYTQPHFCCDLSDDIDFSATCQQDFEVGEQGYFCDDCGYDVCMQCYSATTAGSSTSAHWTDSAARDSRRMPYRDFFLGKILHIPVAQRFQIDVPLILIKTALSFARSRGAPGTALHQPPPPIGCMQIALWPAQRVRFMFGFTARACVASVTGSQFVCFRKTSRWRTCILEHVMAGYVSKVQVLLLCAEVRVACFIDAPCSKLGMSIG